MSTTVLVARLALAGMFAVAGAAKLADLAGSRRALREFGVPGALAPAVGVLLPLAELVVAVALVGRASARWGAVAGLMLLFGFVIAIGGALLRGEEPDCHCFGQLRSSPAGWSTLARNLALAALAGLILLDGPGISATGWLAGGGSGEVVAVIGGLLLLGLIAAQASFSYQLLRQNGRLITRVEALEQARGAFNVVAAGLPVGMMAPGFALPGVDSETLSLDSLRARGRAVLLVFSHPGCGPCQELLPRLARWQREHAEQLTIALVSQGDATDHRDPAVQDLLLQADREVADAYHALATPSAQLITAAGTIASPLAQGADEIAALLDRAVARSAPQLRVLHTGGHLSGVARRRVPAPATALGAGVGILATQALTGEASAASGAAALKQILAHAKPALGKDNSRVGAALKQRATHPKQVPTAAVKALQAERALVTSLHGKVAAVHTTHPAKPLTLSALSLSEQTLHELQRTLSSTKRSDIKRHAADTRALSGKARHAILQAEKALG